MSIRDYCNLNVICCEPDAPSAEVAMLMRKHHVGDVIVVDHQQEGARIPIGIVTDRDILIDVKEIKNPEIEAQLVAENIALQIERSAIEIFSL